MPRLQLMLLLSLLAGVAGCSAKSLGTAKGKVTLDGQPVSKGSVLFLSDDGTRTVMNSLAADGTFEMRTHEGAGLPPGKYFVAVSPSQIGSGATPLAIDPAKAPEE